jgi:ferredoxin-NADP reductase
MKLKLVDKRKEIEDIATFIFAPEEPVAWQAGQFMIYSLPHEPQDIRGKQRFFTNSAAPFEKHIYISTRIDTNPSTFKKKLNSLKTGDEIFAKGPDGDFVIENSNKNYVFLAGGIGITPYRSIILQAARDNIPLKFTLLYSGKTDGMPFEEELKAALGKFPNSQIIKKTERINESDLKQFSKSSLFYVSGPDSFAEGMLEILEEMNIPEENIKSDYFSGYDK